MSPLKVPRSRDALVANDESRWNAPLTRVGRFYGDSANLKGKQSPGRNRDGSTNGPFSTGASPTSVQAAGRARSSQPATGQRESVSRSSGREDKAQARLASNLQGDPPAGGRPTPFDPSQGNFGPLGYEFVCIAEERGAPRDGISSFTEAATSGAQDPIRSAQGPSGPSPDPEQPQSRPSSTGVTRSDWPPPHPVPPSTEGPKQHAHLDLAGPGEAPVTRPFSRSSSPLGMPFGAHRSSSPFSSVSGHFRPRTGAAESRATSAGSDGDWALDLAATSISRAGPPPATGASGTRELFASMSKRDFAAFLRKNGILSRIDKDMTPSDDHVYVSTWLRLKGISVATFRLAVQSKVGRSCVSRRIIRLSPGCSMMLLN